MGAPFLRPPLCWKVSGQLPDPRCVVLLFLVPEFSPHKVFVIATIVCSVPAGGLKSFRVHQCEVFRVAAELGGRGWEVG